MTSQQLRLFIALNPPAELAARLVDEQRALGGRQAPVKWVEPAGSHLTLQFLGNVTADNVEALLAALEQATAGVAPFELRMQGLGAFPNPRRPRVIWAGLAGDTTALERLQQRVVAETQQLGFQPEARGFKPHITIGRLREGADPPAVERLARALGGRVFQPPETWHVGQVTLMRSELHPSGARYSVIGAATLQGG